MNISNLQERIVRIATRRQQRDGASGSSFGQVRSGYSSGNLPLLLAGESETTAGHKTHRVIQPPGNRSMALAAGDIVGIVHDNDDNRAVMGKAVDVSSLVNDADMFVGMGAIAVGNTVLLTDSAEFSSSSGTFVDAKNFFISRPGRYRIKGALSRAGSVAEARVALLLPDGVKVVASTTVTYNGTVYPTFGSQFSLDLTITAWWGTKLIIQIRNQTGGTNAYIKDVTVCYSAASAALTPYDVVL